MVTESLKFTTENLISTQQSDEILERYVMMKIEGTLEFKHFFEHGFRFVLVEVSCPRRLESHI